MKLAVNGDTKQDGRTTDMIFSIAEQISIASKIMTLDPGDVLLTGTPAGVGVPKQTFLKVGDKVDASIEGIGTLWSRSNRRAEATKTLQDATPSTGSNCMKRLFAYGLAALLATPLAVMPAAAQTEIRISTAAPDQSPLSDAFRAIKAQMEAKFPAPSRSRCIPPRASSDRAPSFPPCSAAILKWRRP